MPNPRSSRQRKRRTAGLKPHERALLTGQYVPGVSPYAHGSMHRPAPNDAILKERLALLERYADLIPKARIPVIERYAEAWHGDRGPGEILDPSIWWRSPP